MKRKTNIGKKLKAWRHKKKISLYVICKSEGNGLRPERLKIIEEKDGGTSWALLCYLHFAYTHGFRILDEIWGTDVMQKPVSLEENHTSKKDIQTFETDNENNAYEEEDFDPSEVDKDYVSAEFSFDNKRCLNEQEQRAFIRHHRCPICGSELRQRIGINGPFIGCSMFDNREDRCTYSASGTFEDFTISKSIVQPK